MSHLVFVSYSRANTKRQADCELVRRFVDELASDVEQLLGGSQDEICFFDRTDIEAGSVWTSELSEALRTARLAVCLYSPNYFNSTWCGKELQIFLERARAGAASVQGSPSPTAIIPVIWLPAMQGLPQPVKHIQTHDAAFPESYPQMGLRQIMMLEKNAEYHVIVNALAQRVCSAIQANRLPVLAPLNLDNARSIWEISSGADPSSHKKGSISKTCFVYVAQDGWNWKPYENESSVGAMAQEMTGRLGLQYEEIPCDNALPTRLADTREHDVPTVLFADPGSLSVLQLQQAMRQYDRLYLLNCGLIVPWERSSPAPSTDPRWQHLQLNVCPQKTAAPPPHHDWLSTTSVSDLRSNAVAVIDGIRSQLLKKLFGSNTATASKAENMELSQRAEKEQGLRLDTAPQLAPVAKP